MLTRVKQLSQYLRASLWFTPMSMVCLSVAAAIAIVEFGPDLSPELVHRHPRILGAGAEGSRAMLSSIAGSMITLAGLTFSLTVVALTQASSQYTSRILQNFMRDRANQFVLGSFVSVFAYCLVVLRTIRAGPDEGMFVPSLAVVGGLLMALGSVPVLIFFIHHIATSIQAATIAARVGSDTIKVIKRRYQREDGDTDTPPAPDTGAQQWRNVAADKTGYIQNADMDELFRLAVKTGAAVKMLRGIGDFVVEGTPLVGIGQPAEGELNLAHLARKFNQCYAVGSSRTIEQDVAFGIRQLVDIALRALSPGVNDTTTAVLCIDHLSSVLASLGGRQIDTVMRLHPQKPTARLIPRGATFRSLTNEALHQIRDAGRDNAAVYLRLLKAIEVVGSFNSAASRRACLEEHVAWVAEGAERTLTSAHSQQAVASRVTAVLERLRRQAPASAAGSAQQA